MKNETLVCLIVWKMGNNCSHLCWRLRRFFRRQRGNVVTPLPKPFDGKLHNRRLFWSLTSVFSFFLFLQWNVLHLFSIFVNTNKLSNQIVRYNFKLAEKIQWKLKLLLKNDRQFVLFPTSEYRVDLITVTCHVEEFKI